MVNPSASTYFSPRLYIRNTYSAAPCEVTSSVSNGHVDKKLPQLDVFPTKCIKDTDDDDNDGDDDDNGDDDQ